MVLNKLFKDSLFPLQNRTQFERWVFALSPTFLTLYAWTFTPDPIRNLPAIIFYPLVFLATWLGGVFTGLASSLACLIYALTYLRPHLLVNPLLDAPYFVRSLVFLFTCLLFLGLVGVLQKALKKANAAIGLRNEFLSLAGHELRNPVTALKLQLEMVRAVLNEEGQQTHKTLLDPSVRQLNRLEKLIASMTDTSLLDTGRLSLKKTECDLRKIVDEVVKNLNDHSGIPAHQIATTTPEGNYRGKWDELRIEQIITNIVHNAFKHSQGKPIEIELGSGQNMVWFSVKDLGVGIPHEEHQKIFERFHRLNNNHDSHGLGLGLYLTKRFVDLHEGEITLESSPGQGSRFTVKLPA